MEAEHQDRDEAVRVLYEKFPYPPPVTDLTPFLTGKRRPTWLPEFSYPLFFPQHARKESLDVLIAGCGTTAGALIAACMPKARCVAVDISEASIARSRQTTESHGLTNIEYHLLPLEQVSELGKDFDFIHSHGVIHHLADPAQGLRSLGEVLRPDGVMSIMLYAKYGRTGIYMFQEFCQRLGLAVEESSGRKMQELLMTLGESHPFLMLKLAKDKTIPIEEVMDMVLHPRDVAYTVMDVRKLVEDSGLGFHRWAGQAQYHVGSSPLAGMAIGQDLAKLDFWEQGAAMELYHGTLSKHVFLLTQQGRPTARELFEGERILDAIPSLSAHLRVQKLGDELELTNGAHEAPLRVRGRRDGLAVFLHMADGSKSIREMLEEEEGGMESAVLVERTVATFRMLYEADLLDLCFRPE